MAVLEEVPYSKQVANGVSTVFGYPFTVLSAGDLVVYDNGVVVSSASYTVSGIGDEGGGSVTFLVAPLDGHTILLNREIELERETDYQYNGPLREAVIDNDLDRLWQALQGQAAQLGGALRAPYPEQLAELPDAANRANKVLAFDASGAPILSIPTSGSAAALALLLADSIASGNGDALLAVKNTAVGGVVRTQHDRNNEELRSSDFSTLQAAVTAAAGKKLRIVAGTYNITSNVALVSNIDIELEKGAVIQTSTPGISFFTATGLNNVRITGAGKFLQTVANATPYVGAIVFDSCTDCEVRGQHEFQGMQWGGIVIRGNSLRCHHDGGYFHDWLGTIDDSGAVIIYENASYCTTKNGKAINAGCFGVNIQDPGGLGVYRPHHNEVASWYSFGAKSYGFNHYIGGAGIDTFNYIHDCIAENVSGSQGTSTGSGFYCVGAGQGGLKIHDVTAINCAISTTNTTNIHGGLSISDVTAANTPVDISNVTVTGMTQGHGVVINNCDGVNLGPCAVAMPASNDGSHAGGAALRGNALRIINSSNISRTGGVYRQKGQLDAILVITTSGSMAGHEQSGGVVLADVGCPFRTSRTGADTIELVMTGGSYKTTSNTSNAVQLQGLVESNITGVRGSCGTQAALALMDCLSTNVNDGRWKTTGATGVALTGTCTGSYYGLSNRHNGVISNLGAGALCNFYASGTPASGSQQVGDHWTQVTPTSGAKPGGYCKTAGSPGFFADEANLI